MKQIAVLAGTIGFFMVGCASSTAPVTEAPAPVADVVQTAPVPAASESPMLAPKAKAEARPAATYVTKLDPSGAPMCFDQQGNKALLVHCVETATHTLKLDPSGAPMCFDQQGNKANLSSCGASSAYVSELDPSGARVCFHRSGEKAPLERCAGDTSVSNLVATAY